jgi:type VI secretion system protein VasG
MSLELKPLIGKLGAICRKALEGAAELCVNQGNFNVEIEHLLYKLLELPPDTDAQRIFRYYEVPPELLAGELNRAIEKLQRGNTRTPTLSPNILALLREAWLISSLQFGSESIRSGALILALLDQDALRGSVLESLPSLIRIPRESLRNELAGMIKGSAEEGLRATGKLARNKTESAALPQAGAEESPALARYTMDLTEQARQGKVDPGEGRDAEIRQLVDILIRRRQNNPILVGDAGVGKSAVVEGFARRIVEGEVPPALREVSLRTLDLGLLQAGAGIKGEFESRVKSLISEANASPHPVILFIEEAHALIGAGGGGGQGDAATLLKPALARGELRIVAASTWTDYKKYFEKDAALARHFQVIKVKEPDEDSAVVMLRGIVAKLEKHHNVLILNEAVRDAVRLSHRYLTGRQLPEKAVSVLDTACARVAVAQNSGPPVLEAARRRIARSKEELRLLRREQASGIGHGARIAELEADLERLQRIMARLQARWDEEADKVRRILEIRAQLGDLVEMPPFSSGNGEESKQKILNLQAELETLNTRLKALQHNDPMIPVSVDGRMVASVISAWTGIPAGKMLTDEIPLLLEIQKRMQERLIGQDHALGTIARRVHTYRAGLDDPGKPVGVFMLAGPSGVGKTETAVVLADLLFGGEKNLITVNMSEYQEAHTVSSLKGAPPGYVGHGKGGVLTEAVRRNPYSVVLLDEVEKAHPDVLEVFYQVFDKGLMEDGDGVLVDFKNTLILLTTNLGTETIVELSRGKPKPTWELLQENLRQVLLKHFQPAFLGRMVIVPYYPLGEAEIGLIVRLKLNKIAKRFAENHNAVMTYDDALARAIIARCTESESGARNIDHILTHSLLPALSVDILQRMAQERPFSSVRLMLGENGEWLYRFGEELAESLAQKTAEKQPPEEEDLDALLDWLKQG